MRYVMIASSILFVPALAQAQETPTASPPVVAAPLPNATATPVSTVPGPTEGTRILRGGAQIRLRFVNELTTEERAVRVGDRVRLEVAEDVVADGVTIIPMGTPVTGELTGVRYKGMWGRSGRIEGRIVHMSLGGRTIRMSGAFDDRGVTGTAGVVAAIAVIPVAGFFVTGTSARIAAGSQTNAFIDEDVQFVVTPAPAPPTISVAAPAATTEQPSPPQM